MADPDEPTAPAEAPTSLGPGDGPAAPDAAAVVEATPAAAGEATAVEAAEAVEAVEARPAPGADRAAPAPLSPEEAARARLRRIYGAVGASALLLYASFHPLDLGLLAYVGLVPWLFVAEGEPRRVAAAMGYATTALYHLFGLNWIAVVSPEGWLVTAGLEGVYGLVLTLAVLGLRRRAGLPFLLLLPAIGTALELVRANFPFIRFPWLLLGHSQHASTTLIQVADLASGYGLTFLVLVVNAALLDGLSLLRARWEREEDLDAADARRLLVYALVPSVVLALAWGYGRVRLRQVEEALVPGPRLLVVQPDIPQSLKDAGGTTSFSLARANLGLTERDLARLGPGERVDAIVWSETMWPWPLPDAREGPEARARWDAWLAWLRRRNPQYAAGVESYTRQVLDLPVRHGAPLIVGAVDQGIASRQGTALLDDDGHFVVADVEEHNSVYLVSPDPRVGVAARYDKVLLVPASEFIPGRGVPGLDWFYRLIKGFVPQGFTVFAPGRGPVLMEVGEHRLAPNVCFEISFAELLREATRQGASVHVCPANDAWFVRGGRNEVPVPTAEIRLAFDHAVLRAIESRRGVVRCVNRGTSVVIDPLGRIADQVDPIVGGVPRTIGVEGTMDVTVPTTALTTAYVAWGNWFAWLCAAAWAALEGLARAGVLRRPGAVPPGV